MKKILSIMLCAALLFGVVTLSAHAEGDFAVAGALGNDMVLQRGKEVNIWGTGKAGSTVTVTFKGNTVTGTVGTDGKWLVKLPAMEADAKGNDLTASSDGQTVTLTNILVGEVFLVGGQSNAEKTLSACGGVYPTAEKKSLITAANGNIRYFRQGKADATAKPKTMDKPQENPIGKNKWRVETTSVANSFSAMGFFFAHKMYEALNVPIGMIMVASSGSPLSQLMSAEASAKANYTRFENDIPVSGMYNALMHPFIHMTFNSMIFYQGESEASLALKDYGKYNEYLNVYVEDLREKTGQDFPFYYVQISSHDGKGLTSWPGVAEQRAVQFDGRQVVKNSGMIVSMDMGYIEGGKNEGTDFAHPVRKRPVGERLAALALARDFAIGSEEYDTSPMPDYAYKTENGVVVHFTNVGDGLKKIGGYAELAGFKALKNGSPSDVKAEIVSKDEVLLHTKDIYALKGVGYGLELLAFPEYDGDTKYIANLGNSNDLPAPTFKFTNLLDAKPTGPIEVPTDAPTDEPTDGATAVPGEPTATNGTQTPDGGTESPIPQGGKASGGFPVWGYIAITAAVVAVAAVAVCAVVKAKKKKD